MAGLWGPEGNILTGYRVRQEFDDDFQEIGFEASFGQDCCHTLVSGNGKRTLRSIAACFSSLCLLNMK